MLPLVRSNKAVLNSSPDLPLLFLLIQLVIAVLLLHAAAFVSPKVEIPTLDFKTVKSLTPVILVNVIGLMFNILCLRGVEASFFQVRLLFILIQQMLTTGADCARPCSAPNDNRIVSSYPETRFCTSWARRICSHSGIFHRRLSEFNSKGHGMVQWT